MRPDSDLVGIVEAIKSVTPPEEPDPAPERRGLLWMPSEMRRAFALALYGRLHRFNEMACVLAAAADTPDWVARMALNAVYLPGREADLDDTDNDAPALELALMAMGLNPASVIWTTATTH